MRKRRAWLGAMLRGRSKLMMGAGRSKDGIGAEWCRICESVKPAGHAVGSRLYRPEGTHEEQITTRELAGWEQFPISHVLFSEGRTLGVPAGWNTPASRCWRRSCKEVAKAYGREALGVETRFARWSMMALKGAKPRKVPVPSRCRHVLILEVG